MSTLPPRDGTLNLGVAELRKERATQSLPVNLLSEVIYGSREAIERKQYLDKLIAEDPDIDPSALCFLSHKDRYNKSLQTVMRILALKEKHQLSQKDYEYMIYGTGEWHSLSLQEVFMGALTNLGDDEQLKKYYEKSRNFRIIGCYAQTELAHGSNVKGLLTTATYIPETDMFDLHTPCVEATKWWVGSLGKSSTHAIVFARLILPDGDYGVHSFMVQLRCMETHKSLPGIHVGDIGPKLGFAGVDNGFLRLNHVKIPRTEMLSRFGRVLPGGKYEKPPHSKLGYAGMTATRVNLAVLSGAQLARAATVAIRYSIVRRQGETNGKENQIIDYTVQQDRLFSQLANSYALHFSGSYLTGLIENYRKGVASGKIDTDLLTELHVVSSGLKSTSSTIAGAGIEDLRKCCGGHGYSHLSGLPDLFACYVHICTAEGDNYILTQQTTRFLVKSFQQNLQGKFASNSPFTQYLKKTPQQIDEEKSSISKLSDTLCTKNQIAAYEHRAARAVLNVVEKLDKALASGLPYEEAWNSCLVEIYHASMAHCLLLILMSFVKVVEEKSQVKSIQNVLKLLCDMFCLHHMEKDLASFLEDGYLNRQQVQLIREQSRMLLKEIRPHALGLVEAWDFPDFTLNSAIGKKDGNVYETLFNWAQKEPLNQKDVADGIEPYLRPVIKGELSKL